MDHSIRPKTPEEIEAAQQEKPATEPSVGALMDGLHPDIRAHFEHIMRRDDAQERIKREVR
jgi:hypothetical protein